jgi:hypothetical protein
MEEKEKSKFETEPAPGQLPDGSFTIYHPDSPELKEAMEKEKQFRKKMGINPNVQSS